MKDKSAVQTAKEYFLTLYHNGEFTPGCKIPSETEMAHRLNISRMTWRKVVELLQADGLLVSRHGSGTYLLEPPSRIRYELSQLQSMSRMISAANIEEGEDDLAISVQTAPECVRAFFSADPSEEYVCVRRIRYAKAGAIAASVGFLPQKYCDGMSESNPPKSLFDFLEQTHHITISRAMTELFIPRRDDPLRMMMHLEDDQEVLGLKQGHYSSRGLPTLYSFDYLRSDIFNISIMRTRA